MMNSETSTNSRIAPSGVAARSMNVGSGGGPALASKGCICRIFEGIKPPGIGDSLPIRARAAISCNASQVAGPGVVARDVRDRRAKA